jgi:putative transcriptional regulator
MRKTLARKSSGNVDWAGVMATSEAEIEGHAKADGSTMTFVPGTYARVLGLPDPDVHAMRSKLGLSQAEFGNTYGLGLRTIQQWEQGRARPDLAARILLKLIETEPKVIAQIVDGIIRRRPRSKAMSALVLPAKKAKKR